MPIIARILIFGGIILLLGGLLIWGFTRFKDFKSIPGDLVFKRENFTFYLPLGTSILLSIVLTLLLFLWRKFGG